MCQGRRPDPQQQLATKKKKKKKKKKRVSVVQGGGWDCREDPTGYTLGPTAQCGFCTFSGAFSTRTAAG